MRRSFALIAFVALTGLLAQDAEASTIKLHGTYSRGHIAKACKDAGGAPYGTRGNTDYGCAGPKGTVTCDAKGHCTGTCPACRSIVVGGSGANILSSVLRNSAGTMR
jgi:hypothetical protein